MKLLTSFSLKQKLVTIIVTTTSLISLILLISLSLYSYKNQKEHLIENGNLQSILISEYVKVALDFDDTLWAEHVIEKLREIPGIDECTIYRSDGSSFVHYRKPTAPKSPETIEQGTLFSQNQLYIHKDIVEEERKIGSLRLVLSTKSLQRSVEMYLLFVILLLLVTLVIGFFIATQIQKIISLPIKRLAYSAREISENSDFNLQLTYEGRDDIGILYNEFSNMITTIDKRNRDLIEARVFIDSVIDSMPSLLICVNSDLEITLMNSLAGEKSGSPRQESYGQKFELVFEDYREFTSDILQIISRKKEFIQKEIVINKGMQKSIGKLTVYPLIHHSFQGAVIRIDDITHETEMRQELAQVRKMDAIGQLAGGVAHDFNNMLGGISGAAELLKMELPENSTELQELIDIVITASTRAGSLTQKLLAFGRKGSMVSTVFDMHTILDDTQAILRRTVDKKIALTMNKHAETTTVVGDNSALQNVFMNLGINAGHAMPNGGTLEFKTRNCLLNEEYCNASPFDIEAGTFIEIEVRDSGTGIPQENLSKIFEPFFTTKESGKGTGLGLAASYGTIRDHKGAITVYSEENVGTVFHIYLPIMNTAPTSKQSSTEEIYFGSGKVLLIDDEEIIRISGKYVLEKLGFEVVLASDGVEGIEKFKEETFDLVISDMIMPRMNGTETFYQLKELNPDIPIVISSGFTKDESIHALKEQGLRGFLNKPFRINELSSLLKKILGEKE